MSSPPRQSGIHLARPPTPGLRVTSSTPSSYQSHSGREEHYTPSRPTSLDLTSTRNTYDAYDNWTELQEVSHPQDGASDTRKLLESRARRSSSASSDSAASTIMKQSWAIRWLNSIGNGIEAFLRLPGIRHILWPFQWFDRTMTQIMASTSLRGWRMGIVLGCCMSSIVLGINIAVLVIGATRGKGFENGFAVPMSGLAEDMSRWSSAIHIVVNALSTLLLAASNYTMQVLSSPTRKDIDKAHAKSAHLDIGVLSTRNLSRIPRRRLLLFFLMGLSSIPIHLFYNSAVFYIGANNEYDIRTIQLGSASYFEYLGNSSLDKFQSTQWIGMYDNSLVSYGTVVLVIDEYRSEIDNNTLTGRPSTQRPMTTQEAERWARGEVTWKLTAPLLHQLGKPDFIRNLTATSAISKEWIRMDRLFRQSETEMKDDNPPKFAHVSSFFATRVGTASRIQLSLTFLIIVIVCNSVKLLTMMWVVFRERQHYIVTLGDGAATFLERPDPTTERMCILSKPEITHDVANAALKNQYNDSLSRLMSQSGRKWVKQTTTFSNALNRDREVGSYFIFIVIGVLFALFLATIAYAGKWTGSTSYKWGTASDATFREADSSAQQTLLNAWIANAAQLVLSFCYLAINSECTAMAGAAEWNNLASSYKGLRVTRPVGQQRDTYFLQLPYRWSLPLTIASGGLHWLLSQSIFLVRIDTYDRDGELIKGDVSRSACGFSRTSWITLTICFWLLVGTVGLIGRKKIKIRIPFAASCSLVISAACHPTRDDGDAHLGLLKWGVVDERTYDGEAHCTLSSRRVTKPKAGTKYL
ncbi:hypothetical protein CC86DRAFT_314833 [Ophiobolus disseminans]|uniref:DUF6536 domain-containing protein n=1 Tax=Ophiobolus disseminans TaxID=1469910 RepID=A0A6A7AE81_9PLEO|nr:hypothetical protein CC86DRAFT_314833 [Ophiobolus disseminans]